MWLCVNACFSVTVCVCVCARVYVCVRPRVKGKWLINCIEGLECSSHLLSCSLWDYTLRLAALATLNQWCYRRCFSWVHSKKTDQHRAILHGPGRHGIHSPSVPGGKAAWLLICLLGLKGYSSVNLIHVLTHLDTEHDLTLRDKVCGALAYVVLQSFLRMLKLCKLVVHKLYLGEGSYSVSRCVRLWIKLTPEYPFNNNGLCDKCTKPGVPKA